MERDKENFDGWMIDYMAGRLSEEDLQQFHALLNSDVFYKKRFKELSKEYAKYLIPHFAEEEANNYEKLLHRLDLKKRSHSLASSRYFSWRNMRRIAATVALLITSSIQTILYTYTGIYNVCLILCFDNIYDVCFFTARRPDYCTTEKCISFSSL